MNIVVVVPRVVQGFISQFPESSQNAYKYFNFDHRVVEERMPRADQSPNVKPTYQGPNDLTNADYGALITDAKARINPILAKYSQRVAQEDALHMAIRDFNNGMFDGKVSAAHFNVLLDAMSGKQPAQMPMPVMAKDKGKEKPKKEKSQIVPRRILKQLGVDPHKVLQRSQLRRKVDKGVPHLMSEPGKGIVMKKESEIHESSLNCRPNLSGACVEIKQEGVSMIKNAQQYTERLDKIADELEAFAPELALHVDMVSDVIEGRKEATTLKHDADEKYMNNRFNMDVRKREADEPFMDEYNKSDFEQVMQVRKHPVPIKTGSVAAPYQKA